MSSRHDALLAAHLRQTKLIDPAQVSRALTWQQTQMPKSSLAQVLLHLKYITQDQVSAALRAVDQSVDRDKAPNQVSRPGDTLAKAVGDAKSTSQELADIAAEISKELGNGR